VGFGVWGLGIGVWGAECKGLVFRVWCRVQGSAFRVWGVGFGVSGARFRIEGLGFTSGFKMGLGYRV
jgi:hypothetical protein